MDNQSPPPPPPLPVPARPLRRHRNHGLRNLSIGLIALSILPVALWLVFSTIEMPTQNLATARKIVNASVPTQKPTQSARESVALEQKSTQSDTLAAQKYTKPLQSTKNDLETRMGKVYERDNHYFLQDVNQSLYRTDRNLSAPKQVVVDDKLTAEEVFASRNKNEVQMPDRMFNLESDSCKGCLSEEALSESERLRYFGLVRIHVMVALTLYNTFCFGDGRATGDKAEALAIIENQLKKLPREVLDNAWNHQVKAIEAQIASYTIRGDLSYFAGARWFCDRMNNDVERGHADPIFKTARDGFFPIEVN